MIQITLPPKYIHVKPSDLLQIDTSEGLRFTLEVRQRTREPITGRIRIDALPMPEEKITLDAPTQ